jgi:hypothetical protein
MVTRLTDAMQWFLRTPLCSVALIGRDGTQGVASSYGEAEMFFKMHGEPEQPFDGGLGSAQQLPRS